MRKRIRKVHLKSDKTNSGLACNSTVFTPLLTSDLNEVTCNCCIFTDIFKDVASEKEKERVAGGDELGYEVEHFTKHQLCPYELGKSGSWINSLNCRRCDYNEYFSEDKTDVKCSFKAKNKPHKIIEDITCEEMEHYKIELLDCEIKYDIDVLDEVKSIIKYTFKDEYEKGVFDNIVFLYHDKLLKNKHKQPDLFTKYNLNATHKAFIKECGEVEPIKQDNKNCFGCCFHFHSMHPESRESIDCSGVKCIENKVKFRLKKEEIMSDRTEISINDGTPGKQLSCYFSKLSVGDYFIYEEMLYRKIMDTTGMEPSIECVDSGSFMTPITGIYSKIKNNTVEMVEKVTIQYIRKEQ